jgi:hypothetical protein
MVGWMSDNVELSKINLPEEKKPVVHKPHIESIMMWGRPKTGKSWCACSVIEDAISKGGVVHYVSTDDGFERTFDEYFGMKADEVRKSVKLYEPHKLKLNPQPFFNQVASMFLGIRKQIPKEEAHKHWLIVDVADKFYTWAQDAWVEQSSPQNSITTYVRDAAMDVKRFVEFNRLQWAWIKRLDNLATFDIVENPPCNLLYIFGEKELEVEDPVTDAEKQEADDAFRLVGCKPDGQKKLAYAFQTLVYISGLKEKKTVTLGDRGYPTNYTERKFGRNWYPNFQESRKTG